MDVRLKVDGKEFHLQHMPLMQKYEAEKTLGMNMGDNETSGLMVMLFVAMRQQEPEKPAVLIADEISAADLFSFEEVEDERPLGSETNGTALESPQPTGHLSSGSPE